MADSVKVNVNFETKAPQKFLMHQGAHVTFNNQGKGSFQADRNEFDLILFGIANAAPGTEAKITLSVAAPARLEIMGHPIEGKVAQGKAVWGDSRFFRVR